MNIVIRLFIAIGKAAHGLANLVTSLSLAAWLHSADLEAITKWFHGTTPEEQQQILEQLPPLNVDEQALLIKFQQLMETRYQVSVLQRHVLTLPALPDESY